jgi:hypothetical protein
MKGNSLRMEGVDLIDSATRAMMIPSLSNSRRQGHVSLGICTEAPPGKEGVKAGKTKQATANALLMASRSGNRLFRLSATRRGTKILLQNRQSILRAQNPAGDFPPFLSQLCEKQKNRWHQEKKFFLLEKKGKDLARCPDRMDFSSIEDNETVDQMQKIFHHMRDDDHRVLGSPKIPDFPEDLLPPFRIQAHGRLIQD